MQRSQLTFASPDALGPCMIEPCVTGISALLEPSTTASAAAAFTRFPDNTTLGTAVTAMHREQADHRGCF